MQNALFALPPDDAAAQQAAHTALASVIRLAQVPECYAYFCKKFGKAHQDDPDYMVDQAVRALAGLYRVRLAAADVVMPAAPNRQVTTLRKMLDATLAALELECQAVPAVLRAHEAAWRAR